MFWLVVFSFASISAFQIAPIVQANDIPPLTTHHIISAHVPNMLHAVAVPSTGMGSVWDNRNRQLQEIQYRCPPGMGRCPSGICCNIDAVCCGNRCCASGAVCYGGQYCAPPGSTHCGGGNFCGPGKKCKRDGTGCAPLDAVDCGAGLLCRPGSTCCGSRCCSEGFSCREGQYCVPTGVVYCGAGRWCKPGTVCADEGCRSLTTTPIPSSSSQPSLKTPSPPLGNALFWGVVLLSGIAFLVMAMLKRGLPPSDRFLATIIVGTVVGLIVSFAKFQAGVSDEIMLLTVPVAFGLALAIMWAIS